jgi:hypothetical protein
MLRFDDRQDHEQVFLRSQKRLDVRAPGSYFDTCGGDRNTVVGGKDDEGHQGGDYNITVGNDHQIHIQGGRYDRIEKPLNMTVVGEEVFDYEADLSTMVTNKSEQNAKQIIIEASQKICLKVGSSFILLEPTGVTIVGPTVKIKSGGSPLSTGNPDIQDPLDAVPADTGKPCNQLYAAHGAGTVTPRRRTSRTLLSQHAPEVAPTGPPQPPPCCTITSVTVAPSPANHARTRIGVGEEVDLTVNPGPATWTISGSGDFTTASAGVGTVRIKARDRAGSITVTATGAGCACNITFSVVEPSSWTMKRVSGIFHTAGHPDTGFKGEFYVHPNDVNFSAIDFREMDSQAVTTGSLNCFSGVYHGRYPLPDRAGPWGPIIGHTDADGSHVGLLDTIYSAYPPDADVGTAPPFTVGTMYFPLATQWKMGTGAPKALPLQVQNHEIFATGRSESQKGGTTVSKMYNDPASGY